MNKKFKRWLEQQEYDYQYLGITLNDNTKSWFIKSVHDSYFMKGSFGLYWDKIIENTKEELWVKTL